MTSDELHSFANSIIEFCKKNEGYYSLEDIYYYLPNNMKSTQPVLTVLNYLVKESLLDYKWDSNVNLGVYYISAKGILFEGYSVADKTPEPEATKTDELLDLIDDHLDESIFVSGNSYLILKTALHHYFTNGRFPDLNTTIKCLPRTARKLGWSLNLIHKEAGNGKVLPYEYLLFAKNNISIFKETPFFEDRFRTSTLYKYFTQNPVKSTNH